MTLSATQTCNLQSKRISQQEVPADCHQQKLGVKPALKGLLILLTILFSFFASILAGYCGAAISTYSVIANPGQLEACIVLLLSVVIIAVAIAQDIIRIILAAISGLALTLVLAVALSAAGLFQANLPKFLISIFALSGLGLGLSSLSFMSIRFSLALADILLLKSRWLKLLILATGMTAVVAGCWGVIESMRLDDIDFVSAVLSSSVTARWLVFLVGSGYGAVIILSAWFSNYLRGTPWRYPGTQRLAALTAGSWWGTSFENLDLSNVNFKNAHLANANLRAKTLYRTCFQGAVGLERARVDNQYLDLEYPKVQQLLTHKGHSDTDFRRFNLKGAYLQTADLRDFDFTDTNLTGADFKGADLRGSTLIRTQLAGADFQSVDLRQTVLTDANLTEADFKGADLRGCVLVRSQVARANYTDADLTGVCIEDWRVSAQTCFEDVRCDYVYRKHINGEPSDRYPVDRDFESGEFATLFAAPEDIVELVFKGAFDYAALSLSLYRLQSEAPDLALELKGIEHRDNLWVVKVKSGAAEINERIVQERLNWETDAANGGTVVSTIKGSLYKDYEETKHRLAESERLVKQLAGLSGDQAEALKELTKKSLGNSFFITGSTITNLAGSGKIEYSEAAGHVRELVEAPNASNAALEQLLGLLNQRNVAITAETQQEFIQEILLSEAQKDPQFKQLLLQHSDDIVRSLPNEAIAIRVETAIAQLRSSSH